MTDQEESELVLNHARQLGEHFDAVHIMVSRYDSDNLSTRTVQKGVGNWHARYGMIVEAEVAFRKNVETDDKASGE